MQTTSNPSPIRSQVLTLAWTLHRAGLTFGEAQRKAWKVIRLKKALRAGVVEFTYTKADGTTRKATGTTSNRFFSYERKTDRPAPGHLVTYFDLEKGNFRNFKAANLVDVA